MPHPNIQLVFCHQKFYILIKEEHRFKTSDGTGMGGEGMSRKKTTQGGFISSTV